MKAAVKQSFKHAGQMLQMRMTPLKAEEAIPQRPQKIFPHSLSVRYNKSYMRNVQLFIWCKKIHRYLVLGMAVLGLLMGTTGYMMHEGEYSILPAAQIRMMHNNFSIVFTIVLGVMTLTGLYLFIFPYLKAKPTAPPKPLLN